MRASLSYHHQKITSMFIVVSLIIYLACTALISPAMPANSLLTPIRLSAFLTFIFSFSVYSYLRGVVLFGDYIKSSVTRSLLSNTVLFVNLFTCIAVAVAVLYMHFYSMISFT